MTDRNADPSSRETRFNYPKSTLPDQVRSWDKFVAIGVVNGQPQVFTSEADERKATELIRQALPQMSGLEHAS